MSIIEKLKMLGKLKKLAEGNKTQLIAIGWILYRGAVFLGWIEANGNIDAMFGGAATITIKAYFNRLLNALSEGPKPLSQ